MNAKQLYEMEPSEIITGNVESIAEHLGEAKVQEFGFYESFDKIQIKVIKEHYFDYRRLWRLATVWFDGVPVMVVQNAGREGTDHFTRYITNRIQFVNMCVYIDKIILNQTPPDEYDDYINENECEPGLTHFYGQDLNGVFEMR
jgi:hypothetical protein